MRKTHVRNHQPTRPKLKPKRTTPSTHGHTQRHVNQAVIQAKNNDVGSVAVTRVANVLASTVRTTSQLRLSTLGDPTLTSVNLSHVHSVGHSYSAYVGLLSRLKERQQ